MDLSAITHLFSGFSIFWIVLVVIGAVFIFDAMRAGTARVAAVALALPFAALLYSLIPKTYFISGIVDHFSGTFAQAAVFAILFVPLFIMMYRITDTVSSDAGPMQGILSGLAALIALIVVWLQVDALSALWAPDAGVQAVFGEAYRFWWLFAAYLALAVSRG